MTFTEWKDLPTLQDVARAQADGWEIERFIPRGYGWNRWDGLYWSAEWLFHGRHSQPKMKKVKLLGYLTEAGMFMQVTENYKSASYWIRVPSEDKEIEVPDGN